MKVEFENSGFETNITNKPVRMQIDNKSPVMIAGLRKMLYPNAIKAIAREITANCRDALKKAGNENEPVIIHLPGDFVKFTDFGTGITPEVMKDIFAWYGRSDKRDDNELVGGWGIGGKSAHGYTNSFVIETVVDGMYYLYNIDIDEENYSIYTLVDQHTTKLRNQTSVQIPVQSKDVWEFKSEIKRNTKYWKVQPTFPGYPVEEPFLPVMETDHWAIYLKNTDGCNVLSDYIPYQTNIISIPNKVVLKFKTGELDLTLDRNSIYASDKSKESLQKALETYNKEVVQEVEKQINSIDSFAEVIQVIESLPRSYGSHTYVWKNQTFTYPLSESIQAFDRPYSTLTSHRVTHFNENVSEKSFILLDKPEFTSYDRQRLNSYIRQNPGVRWLYLFPADHKMPVNPIGLSTIKVIRSNSTRVSSSGKVQKTTIKGRGYRYKRLDDYQIVRTSPIIYTTGEIEKLGYSLRGFPVQFIQINTKDEKYIVGQLNWQTFDEYLKTELYSKFSTNEIQELANYLKGWEIYEKFGFLKNSHPDFKFLDKAPVEKKYNETIRKLVQWLIHNQKVTPILPNIYKTFPMLEHLSYIYGSAEKDIINYINLVNSQTQKGNKTNAA